MKTGMLSICAMVLIVMLSACTSKPEQKSTQQEEEPQMSWPSDVRDVEIVSSVDGAVQPAKFYVPDGAGGPVPLLVTLHTWSNGWRQDMGIGWLEQARQRGWAFVHPNFRGPNGRPESTGSEIATADILDAVAWVRGRIQIDSTRIYLAGTSGGGHMSLLTAGRHPEIWAGVSAWVPIFDLARWHAECAERELGYADQMEAACGGAPGSSPGVDQQYTLRSSKSVLMNAAGVAFDINAGIHDGHTGSVPIGHSLRAFNMLAFANGEAEKVISDDQIKIFERTEKVPEELSSGRVDDPTYGEKSVLFRRESGPARVTIFEGTHEGIPEAGCAWLETQVRR
jgi:pimeloyl-ACP methyl ester carboxylesterase